MRTYKNLQDTVLEWMADSGDTGLLQTLVKDALNRAHQNLLNDDNYDFMLWSRTESIAVTAGQKSYALHPRFGHPLFFYNPDSNNYLEEISPKNLLESGEDWQDGTTASPDRFMLTGLAKVASQPSAASVITATTTGGSESSAHSLVIRGTYNGTEVSETLAAGSAWTTITGSQLFDVVEDITKVGDSWSRAVTLSAGATTILTLNAADYGHQYRTFELLLEPTAASTLLYRFYKQPRQLVLDNDIPDLPKGFDDILVYQALIAMHGYTRATSAEVASWSAQVARLTDVLQSTYRATRSINGRPTYTRFIPR